MQTRRGFLAAAGVAVLAGCSSDDSPGGVGNYDPGGSPADRSTDDRTSVGAGTPADGGPVPTAERTLPLPESPATLRSKVLSGGPRKDGIPAIEEPRFLAPGEATFLDDGDPVFGVARDGDVKAYPQTILVKHEIVNDTLAGTPVSVTYCPLTGTVQGFERGETTFGVSGRLLNNNLVMYDRATEAWWPQILATSIPGPWNADPGTASLREFRLVWTTWERWRSVHPETRVLSTRTGYANNYNVDPYGAYNPVRGYYQSDSTLYPNLHTDDRFHPKEVFMGARTPEGAVAVRKETLADERLVETTIGETPALAVFDPRFETGYVYLNPDETRFEYGDGRVTGPGGTHAPDALPLERVHTFDAMWFAWAGYYPDSTVYA